MRLAFVESRREERMVRPLTRRIAINLNRRVANAEPLREHRPCCPHQRLMIVVTRTRDVGGQRDESARDRPHMEVVDIRHVGQFEQGRSHRIDVDVPGAPSMRTVTDWRTSDHDE